MEVHQVLVLTKGNIFGDSEIFEDQPYASGVKCTSTKGTLLKMSIEDYKEQVLSHEDTYNFTKGSSAS